MTRHRILTTNLFELVALWGIAIVQPLLGVFGASAETFIANGIMPHTILPIIVAFIVVPPLVLCGVELLLARKTSLVTWFHRGAIGFFLVIFFAQISKVSFKLHGAVMVSVVVAATAVGLFAFLRIAFIGQWFRYLSVTPVLALLLFTLNTPSGRYALNSSGATHEGLKTNGSSVTFVMLDEFALETIINANGKIDKARFPNFYRLSQISTWYRNYSTTAEGTVFAVPTALSGQIPDFGKGPTIADYPHNLFTWLGESYKMNVSETVTQLCPRRLCKTTPNQSAPSFIARVRALSHDALHVLRQRIDPTQNIVVATSIRGAVIDHIGSPSVTSSASISAKQKIAQGLETLTLKDRLAETRAQTRQWETWLDGISSAGCPCLNFIHILLPHHPWTFYPDGTIYTSTDPGQTIDETSWDNMVRRQRHALQAQYTDKLIGNLLDKLEAENLLDSSEIVVVADHGISFQDGYYRRIVMNDYANYPSILFPPLFIHTPGQNNGAISDVNMENFDLMSVVAAGVGSSWPWKTGGSLPSERTGDQKTNKTLYLQPGNAILMRRPDKKLVVDASEAESELFSRAHSKVSTSDYLEPLYVDSPFDSMRGTRVPVSTNSCSCTVTLDDEVRALEPMVYVAGTVAGNAREGDWFALAVDGKISGLSPVYKRGDKLRILSLLKSEDFTSPTSRVTIFRITSGVRGLESATVR